MFIAHLPAAYLLGHTASRYLTPDNGVSKYVLPVALLGGITPDIDLLYFYTIGARQTVHHEYWSHIPFYWLIIYLALSSFTLLFGYFRAFKLISIFISAILLHLVLDTITGSIQWMYPISARAYNLVAVPAVYEWWVANFIMHWTFIIEIIVIAISVILYVKRATNRHPIA